MTAHQTEQMSPLPPPGHNPNEPWFPKEDLEPGARRATSRHRTVIGVVAAAILIVVVAVGILASNGRGKIATSIGGGDDAGVVEKSVTPTPVSPPTPSIDLGPLNETLRGLNESVAGFGDDVATKVGEKVAESNQVVIEKLDQLLLAQKTPTSGGDDPSKTPSPVKEEDIQMEGGNGEPCPPKKVVTLEDVDARVTALEGWRVTVDRRLKRHTLQIAKINGTLSFQEIKTTDLPGVKPDATVVSAEERSTVVHLKYDR